MFARFSSFIFFSMMVLLLSATTQLQAKTLRVAIGHQSMCTDTYTAGIVVKELKLLEKDLPKGGKYADIEFDVRWSDYSSGGPITNQMLANKLDFGVMGDYPLIVNGAKFQATESLRTKCIADKGCQVCIDVCPLDVLWINPENGKAHMKYDECWYCMPCETDCPTDAVTVTIPYLLR